MKRWFFYPSVLCRLGSGFLLLLVICLLPSRANATTPAPPPGTMKVCLKLNTSSMVDKSYGDLAKGNTYKARGIYAKMVSQHTSWGWNYVDKDDGCFIAQAYTGSHTIYVAPTSTTLGGSNTVHVYDENYSLPTYATGVYLQGLSGATYNVTLDEQPRLRIYGVLTYAIHVRFRGQYSGEMLRAFYKTALNNGGLGACANNGCGSTAGSCFCPGTWGGPALAIGDGGGGTAYDHSALKFIIVHEYGHANQYYGVGDFYNNMGYNCTYNIDNDVGHRLRGREYANCAAVEGWAHFVSGDVFNYHSSSGSSDPHAELFYRDGEPWDLGYGDGGCPGDVPLLSKAYPGDNNLTMYPDCLGGAVPSVGVEMDWARTFWDYHTDTDKLYYPRGHSQLHTDLAATTNWTDYMTAYWDLRDSLPSTEKLRFVSSALHNGVCVDGTCW